MNDGEILATTEKLEVSNQNLYQRRGLRISMSHTHVYGMHRWFPSCLS
jgi:hypothetical protein